MLYIYALCAFTHADINVSLSDSAVNSLKTKTSLQGLSSIFIRQICFKMQDVAVFLL